MKVEFLIGPAGSGKTFRCLESARESLKALPDGAPLIFLAPKQATFQIERELLSDPELAGFTRLEILSFDRLAEYVLDECATTPPSLLSEEGRVMVLRALLAREHEKFRTFKASARTPGFANELSKVLHELQRNQVTPKVLRNAAARSGINAQLSGKLEDLALMAEEYLRWLKENALLDPNSLLELATKVIRDTGQLRVEALWLDGFAEMTPQEIDLLAAILPGCKRATLAFCLEQVPGADEELRFWSVPARAFRKCFAAAQGLGEPRIHRLTRRPEANRFTGNGVLEHLERKWAGGEAPSEGSERSKGQLELFGGASAPDLNDGEIREKLQWFSCANPEMEATAAAREILRLVRNGGRFREAVVLVRRLEPYQEVIQRVFRRYEIPFFVDQRRSVAHHPLAELTRYALRTVAFGWRFDDWFGALKAGLIDVKEDALDRLEIEAIANGWEGNAWLSELKIRQDPAKAAPYEVLRQQIIKPFLNLRATVCQNARRTVTGSQLCAAIRRLWQELGVERMLGEWAQDATDGDASAQVHQTVWTQTNDWLENLDLAFPAAELPLEEWLAIIEAGLCSLTVGVVPPALDQVLIGSVDRSRNPTLRLAVVLGMNEGVFPAAPTGGGLLTETERDALEQRGLSLGPNAREQLAHERYLAYVACTRPRERLVLTSAHFDVLGRAANPSPILNDLQRLFPGFRATEWRLPELCDEAEHPSEVIPALIGSGFSGGYARLASLPVFGDLRERVTRFRGLRTEECLSEGAARRLYDAELRTSITRLERFAECPFRFFVVEGLRAQEKRTFLLDRRKLGDFQHQALKAFHETLERESKRWRDLRPQEARDLIGRIAREHAPRYQDGLFMADAQDRFTAEQLSVALQDMIEVLIGWMEYYQFDPVAVELRFDDDGVIPPLRVPLSEGRSLALNGSIDRVDLLRARDGSQAWCVVVDYKSSSRKPDAVLMHHGIQMQLPAYLAVLRHLKDPEARFGAKELTPAGAFYISLRRESPPKANRKELFADPQASRKSSYRHYGRFNSELIEFFDRAGGDAGEQFNYKRRRDGEFYRNIPDPMTAEEFRRLTERTEARLKEFAEAILRGEAKVAPYQYGNEKPCDTCDYHAICRVDPWTHAFRALQSPAPHGS